MFTHHIITCVIMFASYAYHQTKVGKMILCLMDIVDLFLAVCHILLLSALLTLIRDLVCENSEISTTLISMRHCFWIFMLVWLVARHTCYLTVIYSIYADILMKSPMATALAALRTLKALLTLRTDLRTSLIHLEIQKV